MILKKISPVKTKSWVKLQDHVKAIESKSFRDLFSSHENRKEEFSLSFEDLLVDFSRNKITKTTLGLLFDLAKELKLEEEIKHQLNGEKINETEKREVLHTALRSDLETPLIIDNKNIKIPIKDCLLKLKSTSDKIINGEIKGYTEKKITDVVNIGIGGSDLGPKMVLSSLAYYKNHLKSHFISNIDGDHVSQVLQKLNPETTIFIIVSKTFTTQETITNAKTIKKWFLKNATQQDISRHFYAVSTNINKAKRFGIIKENIFPMWDWVGGRFSLWSAVGLSISICVGFENFNNLLIGAREMDNHFQKCPVEENIPIVLALLGVLYNNFYNSQTHAILPYSQYLEKLPSFLQQASMESNGKSIDRNGNKVSYQTGEIIWGSTGTNMQHAFMQLVHQGTKMVPCDFIGFKKPLNGLVEHHEKLMSNYFGQMEALCFGKTRKELEKESNVSSLLIPFKVFEGNKPSNMILFEKLTPKNLGMLIAMYEHKIFVQGIIWNIYSYDQWGVQLGKQLAEEFYKTKK